MNKNPGDYLDKINSGYLEYIKSQTELNVLIIDVSDKDFKIKKTIFYLKPFRIKINQL
jgi:deoxyadenosine/deoxycytidine kinase